VTQGVHSGPGDLAPGEQVAGYQVQEQIGRGGMAVVYRALDLRLGRLVALKVLAPHLGEDEAFRQRFIRESRAAADVDHPHIVPVFEAGEAGGVLFIAMRYVGYGDVRSLIDAEGKLATQRVTTIASQVASALDAAHSRGLVHRDVKPGNMLLAQAGGDSDHVYLSDFGLSKHSLSPTTLTSTGQFLGTLDYVSPEQIQGQPVDGRADQYALACTVVEMLSGAPPFRRDDTMALMWAQLEAAPPRLTERCPDLPAAVDQVIQTAMSKAPAGRYPTCRAFAAALTAACADNAQSGPASAASGSADGRRIPVREVPPTRAEPAGNGLASNAPAARADGPTGREDYHVPEKIDPLRQSAQDRPQSPLGTRPPTEHARFANLPPTRHEEKFLPGTRQARPGGGPQARSRPGQRRRRNVAIACLIVAVGLAGIAGVGYKLFWHAKATPTAVAGKSNPPTTAATSPANTVRAYFRAINRHQYLTAWKLGNRSEPFATFEAGFNGTLHDTVTIVSTSGNVVTARLFAEQTNGTVKKYQGTYTVTGGVITSTDVQQIS